MTAAAVAGVRQWGLNRLARLRFCVSIFKTLSVLFKLLYFSLSLKYANSVAALLSCLRNATRNDHFFCERERHVSSSKQRVLL